MPAARGWTEKVCRLRRRGQRVRPPVSDPAVQGSHRRSAAGVTPSQLAWRSPDRSNWRTRRRRHHPGRLVHLGVRFALDDSGPAIPTLAHAAINVDILKIDRSFVERIGGSELTAESAPSPPWPTPWGCRWWAKESRLPVNWESWPPSGCDEGQDFLLARPVTPDKIVNFGTGPPWTPSLHRCKTFSPYRTASRLRSLCAAGCDRRGRAERSATSAP